MNLQEIFERQHKRIYRIAMLMLNSVSDAEDAVQNVFLKYIEKEIEFADKEHENAWFITATRNYCKDQLKTYWRRQVDMGEIPEIPIEEEDDNDGLMEYIKKLPDKYKEVIYLYYYEEYSVKEMARILDRNESTIQTQLAAARGRLKKILERESACG